jgi:predicted transcriptional regulator
MGSNEINIYKDLSVYNIQQVELLLLLKEFGQLTMTELTEKANRDKVSVTRQINKLVSDNIIDKVKLPEPVHGEKGRPTLFVYTLSDRAKAVMNRDSKNES